MGSRQRWLRADAGPAVGGSAGAGRDYWWRTARDLGSSTAHGKEWRQGTAMEAWGGGGGGGAAAAME